MRRFCNPPISASPISQSRQAAADRGIHLVTVKHDSVLLLFHIKLLVPSSILSRVSNLFYLLEVGIKGRIAVAMLDTGIV